jgi:hypothetical protein
MRMPKKQKPNTQKNKPQKKFGVSQFEQLLNAESACNLHIYVVFVLVSEGSANFG